MKKKTNKKLPRYDNGKKGRRFPLGYLPNRGVGDLIFSSTPGLNLQPEVTAILKNYLPQVLQRTSANATPLLQMFLNTTKVPVYGSANGLTSTASSIAPESAKLSYNAANSLNRLGTNALEDVVENTPAPALESLSADAVKTGTKTVFNNAGKALGAIGALYGAYNMFNDVYTFGDHRTAADMAQTFGHHTYSTAGGNTYTTLTGPKSLVELAYERAMAKLKLTNFLLDSMGTLSTLGGVIGNIPGAIIGGIGGAAIGGLASLFGWGDNSDEIEKTIGQINESLALSNRQNEAVARSKDYETAENGKRPVWTPSGLVDKQATARVSNGELLGNFEDGKVTRIPGRKNNKDTKLASVKDSDFIISNKYGLSDYAANTGDYEGALALQEILLGNMRNKNGYKKGKLPHCDNGWGEYALATLPHFFSMMSNISLYNRAKNAELYAPDTYVDDAGSIAAENILSNLRFDPSKYLNDAFKSYKQAQWDTNRAVGLGIGGRAVAKNTNFRQYLNALANIRTTENEQNAKYDMALANVKATRGAADRQAKMHSKIQRQNWLQLANGTKESWLAQYNLNKDLAFINLGADALRMLQYNKAQDILNRILKIYQNQADLDWLKYRNSLPS